MWGYECFWKGGGCTWLSGKVSIASQRKGLGPNRIGHVGPTKTISWLRGNGCRDMGGVGKRMESKGSRKIANTLRNEKRGGKYEGKQAEKRGSSCFGLGSGEQPVISERKYTSFKRIPNVTIRCGSGTHKLKRNIRGKILKRGPVKKKKTRQGNKSRILRENKKDEKK